MVRMKNLVISSMVEPMLNYYAYDVLSASSQNHYASEVGMTMWTDPHNVRTSRTDAFFFS